MHSQMRQFIEKNECCQGVLRELATMLPADDAELDALIGETLDANDQHSVQLILLSALGANRVVQARHLARAAALLNDSRALAHMICKMRGDVATEFMECLRTRVLATESTSLGLILIAMRCQENGKALPEELLPRARVLARGKPLPKDSLGHLGALADLTQDAGLTSLVKKRGIDPQDAAKYGRRCWDFYNEPVLEHCREHPRPKMVISGKTLRRAVARTGRNEPCHCGSGKKYKLCCIEKDQERLRYSSDIAGLTQQEVDADAERHLTKERLDEALEPELERFDPAKVPVALREDYLDRLVAFKLYESVIKAFQCYGRPAELSESWTFAMSCITTDGRRDIAERLLKSQLDPVAAEKELDLESRLFLAEDDPARYLELINEHAMKALQTEDPRVLEKFGYALLPSKLSAVGIFIARSMIPILPQEDAAWIFEHLLETRDRLKLSPDDPFSDIFDKQFASNGDDSSKVDAEELHKAQQLLEAKVADMRRLKVLLIGLQREISKHERAKRPMPTAPTPAPASPADEDALRELRHKVEKLKSTLNERHHERNSLRRELQKAYADLDELRQQSPPANGKEESEATAREEALLLPEEAAGCQPVRLIEFPRGFAQTLQRVPPSVARATQSLLGRIAAGELAAFAGVVRLKAFPDIYRRRMGIDFRLMFRLLPDRVQVVDLITRQDLERWIRARE